MRGDGLLPLSAPLSCVWLLFLLCVIHVMSALSGGIVLLSLLPPNSPWTPCPGCLYTWRVLYISIDRLLTGLPCPGRLPMTCLPVHQPTF